MPLILFNKPFRVLSQFRDSEGRKVLADFVDVPGVYPAGRLDYDSEGLLLLTDDGKLQSRISNPSSKVRKTYYVQVEGRSDDDQLDALASGVELRDGVARALSIDRHDEPDWLWERFPPIRRRKSIPTEWLELSIDEGRNRQVRRMTAAVGLPTLRLVRTAVGPWQLGELEPGRFETRGLEQAWSDLRRTR